MDLRGKNNLGVEKAHAKVSWECIWLVLGKIRRHLARKQGQRMTKG